jgi:hypothetical protein
VKHQRPKDVGVDPHKSRLLLILRRLHLELAKMERMKAAEAINDGPKQRIPLALKERKSSRNR